MKRIHDTLLYFLLLSVMLGCIPGTTIAQSKEMECIPQKMANRDKVWLFESYTVLESEYKINGYLIRLVPLAKQDSVYLYDLDKGKKLVGSFLAAKDGRIFQSLSLEYAEDRSPYIDSIVPGMRGNSRRYFDGLLYTDGVRMTRDMLSGLKRYYDSRGQDSLYYVHYPDDSMLLIQWFSNGKDSLHRRWNAKGKLIYEELQGITKIWNDEQRLIEKAFDTLIQGIRVDCIKSWYPSGVLKSTRYFYFDKACLTWQYFNERGMLLRQEKHKKLDEITPVAYAIEPPAVKMQEVHSENVAGLFKQELNPKLEEILCRTKIKPDGTYRVQVWLEASGKLMLNKLDGEYADVIGPEMETFFRELSGARPAQRNGRPYAQLLELTLKVSTKDK
ncbi:MAG: hypothetical protein EOP54_16960 [Sphingobacteriales bacterium]|nr:MAG: hypothetical protein EOP54_16960 [Sphingobacteriales bacterium]